MRTAVLRKSVFRFRPLVHRGPGNAFVMTVLEVVAVGDRTLVLTVEEAAALLGISRGLAYELVRRGDLPSIRLGRRLVVPRRRLLALVEGGAPEPAS